MKITICLLVAALLLTGCSAGVYETIADVKHVSATQPPMRKTVLEFPKDAAILTASGSDMLYTCGDYTMSLQSLPAGDLSSTVRTVCGYEMSQLTVMETQCGDHTRYEWVWTSAGENGDVLCRAAVLDDGDYHYCLSVQVDAEQAGTVNQTWNELFRSFCLAN